MTEEQPQESAETTGPDGNEFWSWGQFTSDDLNRTLPMLPRTFENRSPSEERPQRERWSAPESQPTMHTYPRLTVCIKSVSNYAEAVEQVLREASEFFGVDVDQVVIVSAPVLNQIFSDSKGYTGEAIVEYRGVRYTTALVKTSDEKEV